MTTLAAILALFSFDLSAGAGAAMQKLLAIAVMGGLWASMVFTLVVAPVLCVERRLRARQRRRRARGEGEPQEFEAVEREVAAPVESARLREMTNCLRASQTKSGSCSRRPKSEFVGFVANRSRSRERSAKAT